MDYDLDLFYKGVYYTVSADLYDYGVFRIIEDGAGMEEYEILDEPVFSGVAIFDPSGDVVDEPDDLLFKAAQELLKEVYWDRTLL